MSKLWLIGGATALGALLVVAVIVALLEGEEILPEGTPEAVVQQFLQAIQSEEYELAHSFLSEDLKNECAAEQYFGAHFRTFPPLRLSNQRITLTDTGTIGDSTFVNVRITQFRSPDPFDSGPFGRSESSYDQRFTLQQIDGEWRFTRYPWPSYSCAPVKIEPVARPTVEPRPKPSPTRAPVPNRG